jgi:ketosteroid isomerase-like protein
VTTTEASVAAAVDRFAAAFDRQDVDEIMAAMTTDCVFESTAPPDGKRYEGQAAVRAVWADLFASTPDGRFESEELFVCADRAVGRWRYVWADGHVRGVDIFHVRDGLVAEKFSYVKG